MSSRPGLPVPPPSRQDFAYGRARLLLVAAVAVIAVAVWGVAQIQRNTASRVFAESVSGQRMLTGMLDQETGLRGFALTRREDFLDPFRRGVDDFERAGAAARSATRGHKREQVDDQITVARRWRVLARDEVAQLRRFRDRPLDARLAVRRKPVFDSFRRLNSAFQRDVATRRDRQLSRAGLVSVGVILLLSVVFGGVGYLMIERDARRNRERGERDRGYRRSQGQFAQTMQIMRDEPEAHALVKHHLERNVAGVSVTVLNRNNSDDRLVATTPLKPDDPLAERLTGASPESCLAVRLGRAYRERAEEAPLLSCELCGRTAAQVTCVPSLVSGEVIGSVLIQSARALEHQEADRIDDSVGQAAPVLANLRNLAIAEARAATDALTGLPNARSCRDNLKRMVAHVSRALSPLTAILLDLDHFKQINDRFGHGAGDDVLAATGDALTNTLRTSDFAGRYGGEEFLLLLPDTDHQGGLEAAEKVRAAIAALDVSQVDAPITASLGVATYPVDALDADGLVRKADRALYAAKGAGRNRVELTSPSASVGEPEAPAESSGNA